MTSQSVPTMKNTLKALVLLFILSQLTACRDLCSKEQPQSNGTDTLPKVEQLVRDPSIPGNFSTQIALDFDSSEIGRFLTDYPRFADHRSELMKFYRSRKFAYAWFDRTGLIEQSMDLYYRILNISDEGLPIDIPYLDIYRSMIEGDSTRDPARNADPRMELMISAQYFHYAREAWSGLPESASRSEAWYIPRRRQKYEMLLDSIISDPGNGGSLIEPLPSQYALLKQHLKRLRTLERQNSWEYIRADQKKYQPGDTGRVVTVIRRKLFQTGDLETDNGSGIYDRSMTEAVRRFQYRYGMKEDGIAGPGVIREMNRPLSHRIRQILVNMERTRWMGSDPKGDHLVVNIPQFQLMVYENDTLSWSCRVVVGKEATQTAIFQGSLKYIVFSPYWNVPPGIMTKEILPELRKNPNYLERLDMEWHGDGIRQRPGPSNALGRVKFLFPNSFNMYLHDTPAKFMFEQDKRAFSHGCIRVSEPRRLAIHLLKQDPAWTEGRIDSAMNSKKERYVTLKKTIPVSIVYFTSWVDEKGRLHFREDIYDRDQRLMDMIFSKK
jgi:murein L,D-transpeptidase YcbB/YkuD